MLTAEDAKVITEVDAGTPMGELFRRFWLPAMLSSELPGPDCAPVRVRLLGEDLVAFRDTNGAIGIVDAYCPHRNAPMFFARNEEAGLRCIYHGWKFDTNGRCTDMPNCLEGESFKDRVRIQSYPAWDAGGMVWLYMGPPDRVPPKPAHEFLDAPEDHRYVQKFFVNCNYLQSLENEFGDNHAAFLHSHLGVGSNGGPGRAIIGKDYAPLSQKPTDPKLRTIVDTDFGQVGVYRGPDTPDGKNQYFVGTPFWFPCFSSAGALNAPGVMNLNIKVPVDYENFVFFRYKWSETPISQKARAEMTDGGFEFPELIPGTFLPKQNKSNDYEIDRVKQRFFNYSGMINTPVEDISMVENQRGAVADRTREVLVSTDSFIIQVRRRLLEAAKALAEQGIEPTEPWNPESYRFRPGMVAVEPGTPVEEAIQPILEPIPPRTYGPNGLVSEGSDLSGWGHPELLTTD